jgi:hypothetical protein
MKTEQPSWEKQVVAFLKRIINAGLLPSVPNGNTTLYGTCYGAMGQFYLNELPVVNDAIPELIFQSQCPDTGYFIGPELQDYFPSENIQHDRIHLLNHLAVSAVLPLAENLGIGLRPLLFAQKWCISDYLVTWQDSVDWKNAWFEGNNILFVGQLLVYLRDVEKYPGAQASLEAWFEWLEREIDPATSLWGTNGYCDAAAAVYGGYHQLLVYWHENRPIRNPKGLVDTVMSLRHMDGGFNPGGNGGACEDVDSVDILVNCYKRWDYRRPEIRRALWHCADHILATQNPDGGFPYNRDQPQSHMGIPGTEAGPNVSCIFPTWFRIHTLALCHEIIPEHPQLAGIPFRFNNHLSMGWHQSPPGWKLEITAAQRKEEAKVEKQIQRQKQRHQLHARCTHARNLATRAKNKVRRVAGGIKRRFLG